MGGQMEFRVKLSINAAIKSMMFLSKNSKDLKMKTFINNLQIIWFKKRMIYKNKFFSI